MRDKTLLVDASKAELLAKSVTEVAQKADDLLKSVRRLVDTVHADPTPQKLKDVIEEIPSMMSEARRVLDLNMTHSQSIESLQKDLSDLRLAHNRRAQVAFSLMNAR